MAVPRITCCVAVVMCIILHVPLLSAFAVPFDKRCNKDKDCYLYRRVSLEEREVVCRNNSCTCNTPKFVKYKKSFTSFQCLNSRMYKNLDRICADHEDCHSASVGVEETRNEMVCLNGYCRCKAPFYQMHIEILSPSSFIHDKFCTQIPGNYYMHVENPGNFECEKVRGKSYCRCKDNLTLFTDFNHRRSYCGYTVISGFGARCGQSNFFCSKADRLECVFQKCFCKKSEMYNFTTRTCVPKADYLSFYNLAEYRVTHGVYCYKDSDCIEGLLCSSEHRCSCPGHQKKKREHQMDDVASRPVTEGGESVPVCIQTPPPVPAPTAPPLSPAPQSESHSSPQGSPTLTVRVDVDPPVQKPPSYSNLFDADPPSYEEATRESETALLKA